MLPEGRPVPGRLVYCYFGPSLQLLTLVHCQPRAGSNTGKMTLHSRRPKAVCLGSTGETHQRPQWAELCTNTLFLFLLSRSYVLPEEMGRTKVQSDKHFITRKRDEAEFVQRWREQIFLLTTFSFTVNLACSIIWHRCILCPLKSLVYDTMYLALQPSSPQQNVSTASKMKNVNTLAS